MNKISRPLGSKNKPKSVETKQEVKPEVSKEEAKQQVDKQFEEADKKLQETSA